MSAFSTLEDEQEWKERPLGTVVGYFCILEGDVDVSISFSNSGKEEMGFRVCFETIHLGNRYSIE